MNFQISCAQTRMMKFVLPLFAFAILTVLNTTNWALSMVDGSDFSASQVVGNDFHGSGGGLPLSDLSGITIPNDLGATNDLSETGTGFGLQDSDDNTISIWQQANPISSYMDKPQMGSIPGF